MFGWQGRAVHYLLLLAAGSFLFTWNLGGPTLWDLDEGRNATAALEMLQSRNFIVPTFNGQLRPDKPVLLYWCQIACYAVFGVNEFAVRLPSALAALGTLLLCYELSRAMFRPSTALLAGLIVGSTFLVGLSGRFANPDALLHFFTVLTLVLFWRGYAQAQAGSPQAEACGYEAHPQPVMRIKSRWFIAMGVTTGLAILTKGPIGVLLPGLIVVAFLAWEKRLALILDRRLAWGLLALAVVALPWYIWVAVETRGAFLRGFLWEHNVSRFLSPMDRHGGPPFYYLLVLLLGMGPWSIFALPVLRQAVWSVVRQPRATWANTWRGAADVEHVAAFRFLGVWLAAYVAFFTLAATKLPFYLLPAAVPFAIFTGRLLDRWRLGQVAVWSWMAPVALTLMAAGGVVMGLGLPLISGNLPIDFFVTPSIEGLEYYGLCGLVPLVAAGVGYWQWRRRRLDLVVASFVAGSILFLAPLFTWTLAAWNHIKAPRPLVETAGAWRQDEDLRVGGYQLEHLPSLNFYARRDVEHVFNEPDALAFLRYQVPAYLFLPERAWNALKDRVPPSCRLVARHADLYRFDNILVISNR